MFEVEDISCEQRGSDSLSVEDMQGYKKTELDKKILLRSKSMVMMGDSNNVKFKNSFKIRTLIDGYNSGRTYYLKASNDEQCANIVKQLSQSAKAAKKAKEAKTRFERSQERVRDVYHSAPCQSFVACMIVAMRIFPASILIPCTLGACDPLHQTFNRAVPFLHCQPTIFVNSLRPSIHARDSLPHS